MFDSDAGWINDIALHCWEDWDCDTMESDTAENHKLSPSFLQPALTTTPPPWLNKTEYNLKYVNSRPHIVEINSIYVHEKSWEN